MAARADAATLADAVAELYALTPGAFTAERNRRSKDARQRGDPDLARTIAALKKPSTAAWVVNMLVRHRATEINQVLDLGDSLREAQIDLDAAELRELGRQRHTLVAAVAREARAVAEDLGEQVSPSVADDVARTLQAAMADADAAAAVRSGALLRALVANGVEPADLDGAVAVELPAASAAPISGTGPGSKRTAAPRTPRGPSREELAAARTLAATAEKAAAEALARVAGIEAQGEAVSSNREQLEQELHELRERVRETEAALTEATADADRLGRERDRAQRLADTAQKEADRARRSLDRLAR